MKKMPCLFERDFHDRGRFTMREDVTPGCEWVLAGEGIATRKWDGTACAVIDGKLYKRYDAKKGKVAPAGAIPCDAPDPVTGHHPHWVLVGDEPESKWHREAWKEMVDKAVVISNGTYELIGPKVNGNPEKAATHIFIPHLSRFGPTGNAELDAELVRTFDGIREFLIDSWIEGIVFHHPDGRMCKIRRDDYGMRWPISEEQYLKDQTKN